MKKRTSEDVLNTLHIIHGENISFNMSGYVNTKSTIHCICTICKHEWDAKVCDLLKGHGCRKCASKTRGLKSRDVLTKEDVIRIHQSKIRVKQMYDYSHIPDALYSYKDTKPVIIICPVHGEQELTIAQLLNGTGCADCAKDKIRDGKQIKSDEIKERILKLNPSVSVDFNGYVNTQSILNFTCNVCGHVFQRKVSSFLNQTASCPHCNKAKTSSERTKDTATFIKEAMNIHPSGYSYEKTNYVGSKYKVTITCLEHGDFDIEANSFLQGHGCPFHYVNFSHEEKNIAEYIKSLGVIVEESNRTILPNKQEIDIYIPELKIGFEYDGLYWHNELNKENDYHLLKTQLAKENGIQLYHIFEDEWLHKTDLVKSMISNILVKTPITIYARKCQVKEISSQECAQFLSENHIQGKCYGKVKIGLYYEGELVSVMLFGHARHFAGSGKSDWELLRMCGKKHCKVVGGASKMFKYFLRTYNPLEVITFADKRWSYGNVYHKLGFTLYNESKPSYFYVIGDKKYYRYNFRKSVLIEKYGCPSNMTEKEFCRKQKWYRIYDCGCYCFRYTAMLTTPTSKVVGFLTPIS